MTILHTLASGSSGNALVASHGAGHLLVDAGISCRRITLSLQSCELTPGDLSAILITHTHTDHISGLQTLLKRTDCPVLASERACRELEYRLAGIGDRLEPLPFCRPLEVAGFSVTAIPTAHDAPGSCGFRLDTEDGGVGILTDTGYVTGEAAEILPGVDLAVLECNHDVETLRSGPYPYYLKQRILGMNGHLCNEDAARFAVTLARAGASELILAHLSRENNTPAMALRAVETALCAAGLDPQILSQDEEPPLSPSEFGTGALPGLKVSVAPRETAGTAHRVSGRSVCRK